MDKKASHILKNLNIPHYLKALKDCHFPSSQDYTKANIDFEAGRKRFVLEELLAYKLVLSQSKKAFEKNKSYKFVIEEDMKQRQEKIADRDRKNEELARIANFYEEEEAFFASTERAL